MSDEQTPPEGEISEEQIAALMYQRLAETPVPAVLVQSLASFCDMAAIRMGLGPEGQARADLAQARLSIECARALMPVCEAALGPEQAAQFKGPIAELQRLFAQAVGAAQAGEAPGEGAEDAVPGPPPQQPPGDSGLWVPPHLRK